MHAQRMAEKMQCLEIARVRVKVRVRINRFKQNKESIDLKENPKVIIIEELHQIKTPKKFRRSLNHRIKICLRHELT